MKIPDRLKHLSLTVKNEIKVYSLAMNDSRTPLIARILLWLAIGYLLLPFDIIPDFIPVIGHLDDAVIVPALIFSAIKLIPVDLLEHYRNTVSSQNS